MATKKVNGKIVTTYHVVHYRGVTFDKKTTRGKSRYGVSYPVWKVKKWYNSLAEAKAIIDKWHKKTGEKKIGGRNA